MVHDAFYKKKNRINLTFHCSILCIKHTVILQSPTDVAKEDLEAKVVGEPVEDIAGQLKVPYDLP